MAKVRRFVLLFYLLLIFSNYPKVLVAVDAADPTDESFWETPTEQKERKKEINDEFTEYHLKFTPEPGAPTKSTLDLDHITIPLDGKISPGAPGCNPPLKPEKDCFDLYYFTGENFDFRNENRKNILYVDGGPGRIDTPSSRAAQGLEKNNNIFYFHLRGAGLSTLPPSNRYDKYLRSEYALEDIERLRRKVLETTPGSVKAWDAVIGYSYGTVLAQRYANRYPDSVKKLILQAPVYRNKDTDRARRDQLRSNLKNIYNLIRVKESVACGCGTIDPNNMKIHPEGTNVNPTDNFCFLDSAPAAGIIDNLVEKILREYDTIIEEHGAMGFVVQNVKAFKKMYDPVYPDEFYFALRWLDFIGAPQSETSKLDIRNIEPMVDAAIVLGYYASLEQQELLEEQKHDFAACSITGTIFENVSGASCKKLYCKRLNDAKTTVRNNVEQEAQSFPRDVYVFGISDGLQQWVTRMLREDGIDVSNESCPLGKNFIEFGQSTAQKHKLLRQLVRKIGIIPDDEYCLWAPKDFSHSVPTLILTGGADLVTAGCQAEDVFDYGLTGQRTFVEFPTYGHLFNIPVEIVEKFLIAETQDNFRKAIKNDPLGAMNRTPDDGKPFGCHLQ
jgi:pimeloyl-ACP methyl ester carboxylesterase